MKPVRAKKSLGQHFLKDQNIVRKIFEAIKESARDTVVEIGPGTGVLTKYLLEEFKEQFYAVEVDHESIDFLKENYPDIEGKLIDKNFLKLTLEDHFQGSLSVVGNFPYNISSQIFFKVLENRDMVGEVVCMIQKEVAERMIASHGNKTYGILSVVNQAFYDIEYLFTVSPKVFNPPPKVNSAVIRMKRNSVENLGCNEELFFKVVKLGFNQRRKTLRNSLKTILVNLDTQNPVFNKRPEQLSVGEFIELTNLIEEIAKK